ncbi:Bet1-like protein [Pluteus cervinus]|uniref:Bet1-like protein n=1 Tax=Pluteus cervinus TaxID=181527 RepID=A0ACD3ALT7_9AGAR|nr:Bet1-like protein [Pluteus cervinus]
MSSSRGNNVEATYESQNDQRLDELHAKIRTLRGVTTDIHDDVERQNLMLDDSNDRFASFGASLSQTSQRAKRVFTGEGGIRTTRIAMLVVAAFFAFWILSKIYSWWFGS